MSTHVSDPPSPMDGYRQALEDIDGYSHVVVIQDDAVPCRNFAPALARVIEQESGAVICLFLARLPSIPAKRAMQAMKRGKKLVPAGDRKILPVVATVWPVPLAVHFREWSRTARLPGRGRSDDGCAALWAHKGRHPVYATVPSLVQHPDEAESTIGKRAMWGKDSARTALFFCEDGNDW